MAQKSPPVAVCTSCGKYITYDLTVINQRCSERRGSKRCDGVFGSTLNETDWEKCRYCGGTGDEQGKPCPSCQGAGWGYIRDGRGY